MSGPHFLFIKLRGPSGTWCDSSLDRSDLFIFTVHSSRSPNLSGHGGASHLLLSDSQSTQTQFRFGALLLEERVATFEALIRSGYFDRACCTEVHASAIIRRNRLCPDLICNSVYGFSFISYVKSARTKKHVIVYSRTCHNPYPSVDIQGYGLSQVMGF